MLPIFMSRLRSHKSVSTGASDGPWYVCSKCGSSVGACLATPYPCLLILQHFIRFQNEKQQAMPPTGRLHECHLHTEPGSTLLPYLQTSGQCRPLGEGEDHLLTLTAA